MYPLVQIFPLTIKNKHLEFSFRTEFDELDDWKHKLEKSENEKTRLMQRIERKSR